MAESLQLVWELIANDRASGTFTKVGSSAEGAAGGVGKLLGGLTALAAGGALVEMTKQAADFQSQMLLIQTQSGDTTDNLNTMSQAILGLAGPTAQAPEALATSLRHMTDVGLRSTDAIDAVHVAAEGAAVGHADLEATTNSLTSTIASGIIPAGQKYSQVMGELNAIVGAGDMSMTNLNEALSNGLLPTMHLYGVSLNQVGAALATFGDVNIRGQVAATDLRMAVQSFFKLTMDGPGILAKYHLSQQQLINDLHQGGLTQALTDLHDKLIAGGVATNQWGEIITQVFGKKAGVGLATLLDEFDRYNMKLKQVTDGAGTFDTAWQKTTKTATFQFGQLKDGVDALGIRIGTGLLPAAGNFSSWLATSAIPYVEHLWGSLQAFTSSTGFQTFLGDVEKEGSQAWGAVQSLAGGLRDLGSAVIPPVVSAGGGLLHLFTELPGPMQLAIAGFAALRIAGANGVFDGLLKGAGGVRTAFQNFRADVSATAGVLQSAGVPMAGFSATLQTTAERGMGALKSAGSGVLNMLGGPWGAGLAGATAYVGLLTSAVQAAKDKQDAWTSALKEGGSAMEQAQIEMAKYSAAQHQLDTGLTGFLGTLTGQKGVIDASLPSSDAASKSYQKWYDSLGLVDQKSQDVKLAIANLNEVEKNHSSDSLAVSEAVDKVRRAEQDQKVATDELNQSTKTSVQLSQDQANALLALTGSSLGVKQSYDEFQSSYQQLLSDQAKGQLSTAQLTTEQDALNSSALNVANAAGTAGAAWAKANGVSDTATASQYAQLLALQKVADAMGTNAPAAVTTLIQSLQKSVSQGHLTQQQMDDIAASVDGIPGQKKIDVTADTSQAQNQINGMLGQYNHVTYSGSAILVNGRVVANAEGNLLEAFAGGGMSPMSSSMAQVVKPGTLRVIGDNPVADEAFIPINKSARSMQILGETASRMGLGLHAMANGGMFSKIPWSVTDQFWAQPSPAMLNSIKTTALAHAAAQAVAASAGGAERWRADVDRVLGMLGVSLAADNGVLSLINSESGGNPNAINLTDSNARAGHPSQGLMQTIPGTFERYRSPSLPDNILDPLANIYAGVNYALHNYGVGMLMGGGRHNSSGAYVGYKAGTDYVPADQIAALHKGEAVVPAELNQQQGAPYTGGGPMQITGTLRIDGDGLAHIVDGRIVSALDAVL